MQRERPRRLSRTYESAKEKVPVLRGKPRQTEAGIVLENIFTFVSLNHSRDGYPVPALELELTAGSVLTLPSATSFPQQAYFE